MACTKTYLITYANKRSKKVYKRITGVHCRDAFARYLNFKVGGVPLKNFFGTWKIIHHDADTFRDIWCIIQTEKHTINVSLIKE